MAPYLILGLAGALAAPRVWTVPPADGEQSPRVLLIDDERAAWVARPDVGDDRLHASWAAARAASPSPSLYPPDALADALRAAADAIARRHHARSDRAELIVQLLEASIAAGSPEDLVTALAVAVSLGGRSLDGLGLEPALLERASFDAAAFRHSDPPLGSWSQDRGAQGGWWRDRWLAARSPELVGALEALLSARPALADAVDAERAVDRALYGEPAPTLLAAPRDTWLIVDGPASGPLRRVATATALLPTPLAPQAASPPAVHDAGAAPEVSPRVVVEPSPLYTACRDAADTFPDTLQTPALLAAREACAQAALQQRVDAGGAEVARGGWVQPPLPDGTLLRAVPLESRPDGTVRGVARVGAVATPLSFSYTRAPRVTDPFGVPVEVTLAPLHRTALRARWVAFELDRVPTQEQLAALVAQTPPNQLAAALRPTRSAGRCGCNASTHPMSLGVLALLWVVMRRS